MGNLKKLLVNHILDRDKDNVLPLPKIVDDEFNGDYKMFLYTLTTEQLGKLMMKH